MKVLFFCNSFLLHKELRPTYPLVQRPYKKGSGVEANPYVREKILAKSRSLGCPCIAACAMSKGWHYWMSWHPSCILEVTNFSRELEGTIKIITTK